VHQTGRFGDAPTAGFEWPHSTHPHQRA
jgi:hypothetical protein